MTAGVIAAGDARTAEAGAEILRAGGNAVDAICAASCMAFVAEAPLCGPGGSGVLLAGEAGQLQVLDFFAVVPGLGPKTPKPVDFHHVDIDFGPTTQRFHVGRASAAVPGTLFGLLEAHRRYGRVPWTTLVQPAAAAARRGLEPSDQLVFIVELLRPILEMGDGTRGLFFDAEGRPHFANPALADLLEALAREGEPLLRGPICQALVREFGPENGGLLTTEDLERYAPVWREPLRVDLGDHAVLTNPPPSSGGSLVALGLRLAAERSSVPTWSSPEHAIELAALLAAVDHGKANATEVGPLDDAVLATAREVFAGKRRPGIGGGRELGSTTHISVLDAEGQVAALTMSNGEGCGYSLPAYGMHINNFLGEEDINPAGFHQQTPGTWMTTMMAPTAVLHHGKPALVLGTGGSNRIRSALLLTLLHTLTSERSLEQAVVAPRMHVEGSQLWYERSGLPEASEAALREAWPGAIDFGERNMFFGGVHAIDGRHGLVGVGDGRRGGTVIEVQ
ncbi:MAG: gamma-glutamyltransferase [Myxococcota bacterium]